MEQIPKRLIDDFESYVQITQDDVPTSADNMPYYILNDTTPEPTGLRNHSALCWINSLTQALLSLAPLYESVRLAVRPTPVAKYFGEMFRAAYSATPAESCEQLLDVIATSKTYKRAARFDFREQNCAQEAFTLVMDCIGTPADNVSMLQRTLWETCPACAKDSDARTITANYLDVYTGELFRAGFARVAPLMTPHGFSMYLTMRPSALETFVCAHCKQVSDDVLTYSKLDTARSIVTVVLHKYDRKTLTMYPLQITFPAVHIGELVYDLCAIIRHYGSMSSGHYTAVVRRGNPHAGGLNWWLCNDSSVEKLPGAPASAEEDYMLFYSLRGVFIPPANQ